MFVKWTYTIQIQSLCTWPSKNNSLIFSTQYAYVHKDILPCDRKLDSFVSVLKAIFQSHPKVIINQLSCIQRTEDYKSYWCIEFSAVSLDVFLGLKSAQWTGLIIIKTILSLEPSHIAQASLCVSALNSLSRIQDMSNRVWKIYSNNWISFHNTTYKFFIYWCLGATLLPGYLIMFSPEPGIFCKYC